MEINHLIRTKLKELIEDGLLSSESEYTANGLYLKYADGSISATTDTGHKAYGFLKSHILGSE